VRVHSGASQTARGCGSLLHVDGAKRVVDVLVLPDTEAIPLDTVCRRLPKLRGSADCCGIGISISRPVLTS
jgi:hypothetical protein